jgi:putative membrane protein
MRGLIARLFVTAFGLWMADMVLAGVRFDSVVALWFAALLLGLVNAFVRPVVIFLTLPLTLVTLGLFLFVVNGAMLLLVAALLPTFHIDGLVAAVLASVIVGLTAWAGNAFVGSRGRVEVWKAGPRDS